MIYKMLNELCILHMRLCRLVPFFILAASPSSSFSPSHSNSRLPLLLSHSSPCHIPTRSPISNANPCRSLGVCTCACVLDMVLALINWRGVRLQQLLLLLLLLFSSSCSSLWESHERFAQCQCLSKYSAAFAEDLYNQVI